MVISQPVLNGLRVRFSNDYAKGYSIAKTWYEKVSSTVPSDGEANVYGWMAELPEMRKWVGERMVANIKEHVYQLPNDRYELTYAVNADKIKNDKLAIYALHFKQLGDRTRKHPDLLMQAAMQNGQNVLTYTGVPFFSTTIPIDPYQPGLGTYQNYWSSGMALNAANYEFVRSAMMNFRGESGTPLGIMPDLLVVPPQLEMIAKRILKSSMIPAVSGASAPETNVLENSAEICVAPDLANQPTRWYLLCTNRGILPFIYQLREASEFAMLTSATDPNVFMLNQYNFGSTVYDAAGYTLPFLASSAQS